MKFNLFKKQLVGSLMLFSLTASAQTTVSVQVQGANPTVTINKNIYGHFLNTWVDVFMMAFG